MGYSNGSSPRAANIHAYVNDTDPLQGIFLDWGGMHLMCYRRLNYSAWPKCPHIGTTSVNERIRLVLCPSLFNPPGKDLEVTS